MKELPIGAQQTHLRRCLVSKQLQRTPTAIASCSAMAAVSIALGVNRERQRERGRMCFLRVAGTKQSG